MIIEHKIQTNLRRSQCALNAD